MPSSVIFFAITKPRRFLLSVISGIFPFVVCGQALAATLPGQLTRLSPELNARVLITAGDSLTDGTTFPFKNDMTAFIPLNDQEGYLLVGHELAWGKDPFGGRFTRLRLRDGQVVQSQLWTSGMHNNCAGTVTPWGTVLSGEEYPEMLLPGSRAEQSAAYLSKRIAPSDPAASFGWIYEISPLGATPAGQSQRRTALGRFSHESASVIGEREVYLTEDADQGYFYRFVAERSNDLSQGTLYAYDRKGMRWLQIQDVFNAHLEAMTLGATPFNRLEDLQLGPDGMLYVAETGSHTQGDPYGRILRFDPKSRHMESFLEGDGTTLANPDNLIFDRQGRLIICEDQYDQALEKFGPNQVLRRETNGRLTELVGLAERAEPTGPSFSRDGHTLYLSVMAGKNSAVLVIDGKGLE